MEDQKDIKAKNNYNLIAGGDGFYNYVLLKTEKLSSAIYLVTDFLSDNEPLKWKLRSRSLGLLSAATGHLKDIGQPVAAYGWEKFIRDGREIVSLLGVGLALSAVSRMNWEILRQEYSALLATIEERLTGHSLQDYLLVQNLRLGGSAGAVVPHGLASNQTVDRQQMFSDKTSYQRHIGQKDKTRDTANDLYGLNTKEDKKSVRKEQVISWLKDKSWTSIAEIAKALPDCGSKTVQRELLEMVALGILKKQGERRWSRYMLG